jgi:hypothetical protein
VRRRAAGSSRRRNPFTSKGICRDFWPLQADQSYRSGASHERAAKITHFTAHSDSDVLRWLTNDTRGERFLV